MSNKKNSIELKWKKLSDEVDRKGGDGASFVSAMKKLYSVYSPDLLSWLGGLFDKRIGGFYYSETAKNSDGFLPDIESTYQALALLHSSRTISDYGELPESVRRRIAGFICSLEDPNNGYFYHPQWSKLLVDSKTARKSRDLLWAVSIAAWLDFELPYSNAYVRMKEQNDSTAEWDGEIFASRENFLSYLSSLDFKNRAESSIFKVTAQTSQICAAGLADVAVEFFNSIQNQENGLWSDKVDVVSVHNFASLSGMYQAMNRKIPNADKAVCLIVKDYLTNTDNIRKMKDISRIRRFWAAVETAILNLRNFGDEREKTLAEEMEKRLLTIAPDLVAAVTEVLPQFKSSSGAFTYMPCGSPTTSSGVPVAPFKSPDGDVNATVIAVGIVSGIYRALGLWDYMIELFDNDGFKKFVSAIE